MGMIKQRLENRPVLIAGVVLAALGAIAGGVALASIPDHDGTIHACYQKSNGGLRVVDSGADCRTGENALSWNSQGPPGPPGRGVAARIRSTGPTPLTAHETTTIPLSANTWTQDADEFQELVGEIQTSHVCSDAAGPLARDSFRVLVDGQEVTNGTLFRSTTGLFERVLLFEPGTTKTHTLTLTVTQRCPDAGGPATIDTARFDVLSAR